MSHMGKLWQKIVITAFIRIRSSSVALFVSSVFRCLFNTALTQADVKTIKRTPASIHV